MTSVMRRMGTGLVVMTLYICMFFVRDPPVSHSGVYQCHSDDSDTCSDEQSTSFTQSSRVVSADPEGVEPENWTAAEILLCYQNFQECAAVGKVHSRPVVLDKVSFPCQKQCKNMSTGHGAKRAEAVFGVLKIKVLITEERVELPATISVTCQQSVLVRFYSSASLDRVMVDFDVTITVTVTGQQSVLVRFYSSASLDRVMVDFDVTITVTVHLFSELAPSSSVPGQDEGTSFRNTTPQNPTAKTISKPAAVFYMPDGKGFRFSDWCKSFLFNHIFNHKSHCQRQENSMAAVLFLTSNIIYRFIVCLAIFHTQWEKYGNAENNENTIFLKLSHFRHYFKKYRSWVKCNPRYLCGKMREHCADYDSIQLFNSKKNSRMNTLSECIFCPLMWCLKSGVGNSGIHMHQSVCTNCHCVGDLVTSDRHHYTDRSKNPCFTTIQVYPVTRFLPDPTFNPEQDLSHVGYRLATLCALPSSVSVSRVRLADAGFYSRGHNEEVVCYSCHLRVSDWSTGGDPWNIHRELSPHCEHVLARHHELASLASGSRQSMGVNAASTDHQHSVSSSSPANSHEEDSDNTETQLFGANSEAQTTTAASARATGCSNIQSTDADPAAASGAAGGSSRCLFPQPALALAGAVYPMFQDIASRRHSFTSAWDDRRAPPFSDVIMSGMFYAGYADCVRCFYCGVGLKNWTVTDSVWTEHVRWRPTCGFLRAIKGDDFIRATQRQLGITSPEGDASQHTAQGSVTARGSQDNSSHHATTSSGTFSSSRQVQTVSAAVQTSSAGAGVTASTASPTSTISSAGVTASNASPTSTISAVVTSNSAGPSAHEEETTARTGRPGSVSATRTLPCTEGRRGEDGGGGGGGQGVRVTEAPGGSAEGERLASLQAETRQLSQQLLCRLCHLAPVDTILMPCGHLVICGACAASVIACPLCHCSVRATARVYLDRSVNSTN